MFTLKKKSGIVSKDDEALIKFIKSSSFLREDFDEGLKASKMITRLIFVLAFVIGLTVVINQMNQ